MKQTRDSTDNGVQQDVIVRNLVQRKKISTREVLDIFPALLSVLFAGFTAALRGIVGRDEHEAKTLHLHIGYAILRKATQRFSILQLQLISPSTDQSYKFFASLYKKPANTVNLAHGAKGHWVGNPNAKNVLIYYHGGGFALPANLGYFQFLSKLVKHMSPKNDKQGDLDLAVFFLSYTLTPHARYPTQLAQAVECLRHVNFTTDRRPANIYLAGDSAGGNLVAGVLSHLYKPHPDIKPVNIGEPLGGSILISPWTLMDKEFKGFDIDSRGDIITEAIAPPWAGSYVGVSTRDYYTDLSHADQDWYRGIGQKTRRVLMLAGQNEILLPIIEKVAETWKPLHPSFEFAVTHRECHVAPVYNRLVFSSDPTEQEIRTFSWLRNALLEDREQIPKLDKLREINRDRGLEKEVSTEPSKETKETNGINGINGTSESNEPKETGKEVKDKEVNGGDIDTKPLALEPKELPQPVQDGPVQYTEALQQDKPSSKSKSKKSKRNSKSKESISVQEVPMSD